MLSCCSGGYYLQLPNGTVNGVQWTKLPAVVVSTCEGASATLQLASHLKVGSDIRKTCFYQTVSLILFKCLQEAANHLSKLHDRTEQISKAPFTVTTR
jgi:hypothetical protein